MKKTSKWILGALSLLVLPGAFSWALTEPLSDWNQRIRVGGSAAFRYMDGEALSQMDTKGGFMIYQAGLVVDADITDNLSFLYDTGVIREGSRGLSTLSLEQIYARYDRVLGWEALNVKVGRTFMPFGEEYLRWNSIENPLNSMTVSYPWALDEGVLLFGSVGKVGYAASVQNGNSATNYDDNSKKTAALKLSTNLLPSVYISASYLYLGRQGDQVTKSTGVAEMWLSGHHITPLGATTASGGPSPSATVSGQAGEFNLKINKEFGQIWANAGYFAVNDGGGNLYDRIIRHYTGEIVAYVPRTDKKYYVAGRYSVIGTFSSTLGYKFAGTEFATTGNRTNPYSAFNYNQRDLERVSVGGGVRLSDNAVFKLEYSREETHLIDSAMSANNVALLKNRDFYIAELGFRF